MTIAEIAAQREYNYGRMTIGECMAAAAEAGVSTGEAILTEACDVTGRTRAEVLAGMEEAFAHNLRAAKIGAEEGKSFLLGTVGQDLTKEGGPVIVEDPFVNKVVAYTLAAQVGNHSIGLRPCAGTGDSCPYTGFIKALKEDFDDEDLTARIMAVILKIGGEFRIGKATTGCNMEGFGAGAAATAAAFVERPPWFWPFPPLSACPVRRGCWCLACALPISAGESSLRGLPASLQCIPPYRSMSPLM